MRILGIMSGSSLDGIDLAVVSFCDKPEFSWEIEFSKSFGFVNDLKDRLTKILDLSINEFADLRFHYSKFISDCIIEFESDFDVEFEYCSIHGHTVLHDQSIMSSWQMLNPGLISSLTKKHILADFRNQDMGASGIGTPMAALVDRDLFSKYDYCINLGGIANISFNKNGKWEAFDIVPCNQVHNHFAQKLGKEYDRGGKEARSGVLIEDLYQLLLNESTIMNGIPKAIDNVWIQREWIVKMDKFDSPAQDILNTHYHIVAKLISEIITNKKSKILLTGGGAKNTYFVEVLSSLLNQAVEICVPDEELIDFKESLLMAYMAYKRIRLEANFMHECTGADFSVCGGSIYYCIIK